MFCASSRSAGYAGRPPDQAMEPATPVAASEPEGEPVNPAPVDTPASAPAPPIGTPREGMEQGMGHGLESNPYPPELPHGSQAA